MRHSRMRAVRLALRHNAGHSIRHVLGHALGMRLSMRWGMRWDMRWGTRCVHRRRKHVLQSFKCAQWLQRQSHVGWTKRGKVQRNEEWVDMAGHFHLLRLCCSYCFQAGDHNPSAQKLLWHRLGMLPHQRNCPQHQPTVSAW